MVEVVLRAVRVDVGSSTPLLLLEEVGGERVLPIFVGAPEATAIAYALQSVIAALGAQLFAVEITELVDNTYFANLRLLRERTEINVSARPSDAVALALRVGSPILVSDQLMNEQGKVMHLDESDEIDEVDDIIETDEEAPTEAELVAELRDFLETIRPEDFNQ
jgi:bifunctional DNase/RNase